MSTFSKYPKDWIGFIGILLAGIFTVMGTHFADAANKPFWWKAWPIIAIVCGVGLLVLWLRAKSRSKQDRNY